MDNEIGWWLKASAYAVFASVGGMVGHIMRVVDQKQKIAWPRAWLEGVAAGFVGILMLLICDAMKLGQQWTGVIVGVSGWMGATASITLLEKLVRKRLDVPSDPKPPGT
jgi:hypothetical protein